jgi:hypothetical protein
MSFPQSARCCSGIVLATIRSMRSGTSLPPGFWSSQNAPAERFCENCNACFPGAISPRISGRCSEDFVRFEHACMQRSSCVGSRTRPTPTSQTQLSHSCQNHKPGRLIILQKRCFLSQPRGRLNHKRQIHSCLRALSKKSIWPHRKRHPIQKDNQHPSPQWNPLSNARLFTHRQCAPNLAGDARL